MLGAPQAPASRQRPGDSGVYEWVDRHVDLETVVSQARIAYGKHGLAPGHAESGLSPGVSDTGAVVAALVASHQRPRAGLDEDVAEVLGFVLGPDAPPTISEEALALLLGVDRRKIPSIMARAAMALACLARIRWRRVEELCLKGLPRQALVHYIEAVQYDETEMKARILGDNACADVASLEIQQSSSSSSAGGTPGDTLCAARPSRRLALSASQAPQRIMQTRLEYGLVLQIGQGFVSVSFKAPSPLAVLERATAACIAEQQMHASTMSRVAAAFCGATRAVTTDACAANLSAEASILKARGTGVPSCDTLHVRCDVHCTALVYDKTLNLVDQHVSGRFGRRWRCGQGPP